jgi:NAD(P)H dehydrogenase (quinone)
MVIAGVPFTEKAVNDTRSGGTPYGASHVAGSEAQPRLSDDERSVAQALGRRIARLALAIDGAGPI